MPIKIQSIIFILTLSILNAPFCSGQNNTPSEFGRDAANGTLIDGAPVTSVGIDGNIGDGSIGDGRLDRWTRRANRRADRSLAKAENGQLDLNPSRTLSIFGAFTFGNLNDQLPGSQYSDAVLDVGYSVGIASGRRHGPRFRSELEFAFRSTEVSSRSGFFFPKLLSITPFIVTPRIDGEVDAYSGMANFYYDFDRAPGRWLTPYIGVGLGISFLDTDIYHVPTSFSTVSGKTISNETLFAFQAIGGVSAKLTRRADFFTEYRFFSTTNGDFEVPGFSQFGIDIPSQTAQFRLQSSQLNMGIRFKY